MGDSKTISRNLLIIFGCLILSGVFINTDTKEVEPDQHREACLSPVSFYVKYDASNLVSPIDAPKPKYALQSDLEIVLETTKELNSYARTNEVKIRIISNMLSEIRKDIFRVERGIGASTPAPELKHTIQLDSVI